MATPLTLDDEPIVDSEGFTTVRVRQKTLKTVREHATRLGLTHDELLSIALDAAIDRSFHGFHVESAFGIREVQALELRIEQLVVNNLSLQSTLFALEGAGLNTLIDLSVLARTQIEAAKR